MMMFLLTLSHNTAAEIAIPHSLDIECKPKPLSAIQQVNWYPPEQGEIKINCDGCSLGNPGRGGAGLTLRDYQSNLLGILAQGKMASKGDKDILCICGGGTCKTKVSKTSENPGRAYLTCPKGCGFFQWFGEASGTSSTFAVTKNDSSEQETLARLRTFVEMKQAITNDVCAGFLKKMDELGINDVEKKDNKE
ncbi:hypothetical protein IFM89_017073 [Coptis chinensis]|uniref:GRF-type domain-containing protein n=1 Tax=Coptis chinensis TaxID=261450 RepID=A0A835IWJ3_9MAGN|nr:hypothetical protein IFM89_017073 [Coptis chinensis]